jgi:hypothetical protein
MKKEDNKDLPLLEITEMAAPLISSGCTTYQKFTCSLCSSRQTIDVPNVFYKTVKCELCGTITDLTKIGCGFALVMNVRK